MTTIGKSGRLVIPVQYRSVLNKIDMPENVVMRFLMSGPGYSAL